MDASAAKKRIVILGGGFGGVYTARHLEGLVKHRPDVEIVLANASSGFEGVAGDRRGADGSELVGGAARCAVDAAGVEGAGAFDSDGFGLCEGARFPKLAEDLVIPPQILGAISIIKDSQYKNR